MASETTCLPVGGGFAGFGKSNKRSWIFEDVYKRQVDSLLQDNVKAVGDSAGKEIEALIRTLDDKGKQFILDVVKRYSYYHQSSNGNP